MSTQNLKVLSKKEAKTIVGGDGGGSMPIRQIAQLKTTSANDTALDSAENSTTLDRAGS